MSFPTNMKSRPLLVLGILSLLALVLRLVGLGNQPLWFDESVLLLYAQIDFLDYLKSVGSAMVVFAKAPLVTALLRGWIALAGTGEVALRLPFAILGALTVVPFFLLARRIVGANAGLIAAALLAISPLHIYYSQQVAEYVPLLLLACLSMELYLGARERAELRPALALFGVNLAAVLVHPLFVLVIACQIVLDLPVRPWLRRRTLWVNLALPLLMISPMLIIPPNPWATKSAVGWIPAFVPSMLQDLARTLTHGVMTHGGLALADPPATLDALLWIFLAAAVLGAAAMAVRPAAPGDRRHLALLLVWVLLPPVALMVLSLTLRDMFVPRYLSVTLLPLLCLAGVGLQRLAAVKLPLGLLPGVALAVLLGHAIWLQNIPPGPSLREAAALLRAEMADGDGVVSIPDHISITFGYHYDGDVARVGRRSAELKGRLDTEDPWSSHARLAASDTLVEQEGFEQWIGKRRRIWLVDLDEWYQTDELRKFKARMAEDWVVRRSTYFGYSGVRVTLYIPDLPTMLKRLKVPASVVDRRPPAGECKHPDQKLSGTLGDEATWCGEVDVTGPLYVPRGVTLKIKAGTLVRFAAPAKDDPPGQQAGISVEGTLLVEGSVDSPVRFTSGAAVMRNGDWRGITLIRSEGSRIDNAIIEYPSTALRLIDSKVTVKGVVVEFATWEGLEVEAGSKVTLEGSRVTDCGGDCVRVRGGSEVKVRGTYVARCGSYGLAAEGGKLSVSRSMVDGGRDGVSLWSGARGEISRVRFTGQRGHGVACRDGASRVSLEGVQFDGLPSTRRLGCEAAQVTEVEPEQLAAAAAPLPLGGQSRVVTQLDYRPGQRPRDEQRYHSAAPTPGREVVGSWPAQGGDLCGIASNGDHILLCKDRGRLAHFVPDEKDAYVLPNRLKTLPVGMTWREDNLWVLSDSGKLSLVNMSTGVLAESYDMVSAEGRCRGLAYTGREFVTYCPGANMLLFFDNSGVGVREVPLAGGACLTGLSSPWLFRALAWDGEALWAAGDRLYKISPGGKVLGWVAATADRIGGIAWRKGSLWVGQRTHVGDVAAPGVAKLKLKALRRVTGAGGMK